MSDAQDHSPLLVERVDDGPVTTLWLNRPLHYNALSDGMLDALERAISDINHDPDVRVLIIGGRGKAFSAGHDLKEMQAKADIDAYRALFGRCAGLMQSLQALAVPVIARVHGVATAAGCQLVAACDLAIAGKSARFAVSGINVGLFCSTPAVAISRNMSTKHAFDMLVTGRFVDAETAMVWGLVNRAVEDDQLDDAIASLAANIAAKSPAAIRHGKALFYRQREMTTGEAYALAAEVMAQNMMEDDASEGIDAFLSKRVADFSAGANKTRKT